MGSGSRTIPPVMVVVCCGLAVPALAPSPTVLRQLEGPSDLLQLQSEASDRHPPSCTQTAETSDVDPPAVCQFLTHTGAGVVASDPSVEPLQEPGHLDPPSRHKRSQRMLDPYMREDESLAQLVSVMVQQELSQCVLVVAADDGFTTSLVMDRLLRLPNPRQVLPAS